MGLLLSAFTASPCLADASSLHTTSAQMHLSLVVAKGCQVDVAGESADAQVAVDCDRDVRVRESVFVWGEQALPTIEVSF